MQGLMFLSSYRYIYTQFKHSKMKSLLTRLLTLAHFVSMLLFSHFILLCFIFRVCTYVSAHFLTGTNTSVTPFFELVSPQLPGPRGSTREIAETNALVYDDEVSQKLHDD
jgi:hypothetical protein